MSINCPLCQVVEQCHQQTNTLLIHEFPHSYLLFGEHQFYLGYCLLVLKQHARECHQLPIEMRNSLWQELMRAGQAINEIFQPWKMNYASYGNQVEHIHWHIFPRYESESTRHACPFSNHTQFKEHPTHIHTLTSHKKALISQLNSLN
jgi:diadenosine tetraphosphate (Ap4A) HIT family hydrolase